MLIALAGLLVGLVALLAIPADVVFAVQRDEGFRGSLTIHWLFGAVRIPVRSARGHAKGGKAKGSPAPRRPHHGRRAWAMLRSEGFVSRLLRLLRSLVTRVRIRHLSLYLRLGLDDPADTGQLWGMLGPLAWAMSSCRLVLYPSVIGCGRRML